MHFADCDAHEQAAVIRLADGDVAGGEVGEHRRAGERGERARRQRHPEVLADLEVQHEAGAGSRAANSSRVPNGTSWPSRRSVVESACAAGANCRFS